MGEAQITIQSLGAKGDGASFGPRGAVFVDRTAPGDRIKAEIFKDQNGVVRGELIEILTPSPHRQVPPCVHYDHCGGCTLQHVTPKFYRDTKIGQVRAALQSFGLRPQQWLEPVFLPGQNRRRATFSAIKRGGKVTVGYYRRRSHDISNIDTCLVADPKLMQLRSSLARVVGPLLRSGTPLDLFVQLMGESVELVVTGPVSDKNALEKIEGFTRVSWRYDEESNPKVFVNRGLLQARFGPLHVSLPPAAFLQPTPQGEAALVKAVTAALPKEGKYGDLFCGCGTFSGPMLEYGSVDSYESDPSNVKALAKARAGRDLRVFRRDLYRQPLRREELNRYDAVVFDPPRAGCEAQAENLADAKTGVLIGVSCNPATFARDARILCDGGYWLNSIQLFDQFQWSHQVEVVGVFTKRKRGARR